MKAALGYAAVAFGAGASVVGITALLAGLQLRDAVLLRFDGKEHSMTPYKV